MSKAEWYHAIKMECVESIQNCDDSIPMIIAFNEIEYCNEPERSWRWGGSWWQPRWNYVPHNPFSHQKKPYNPSKLRYNPKYKPRGSLHRRTNSGSGWW